MTADILYVTPHIADAWKICGEYQPSPEKTFVLCDPFTPTDSWSHTNTTAIILS